MAHCDDLGRVADRPVNKSYPERRITTLENRANYMEKLSVRLKAELGQIRTTNDHAKRCLTSMVQLDAMKTINLRQSH